MARINIPYVRRLFQMPATGSSISIILIILCMLCIINTCAAESIITSGLKYDLQTRWNYQMEGIIEIQAADLDNDASPELIILSNYGIHVVHIGCDSVGCDSPEIMWEYPIKNARTLIISNMDTDPYMEIVVSSGVTVNRVERGTIHILGKSGELKWRYALISGQSNIVFNNICALDIDGNGYKEIIGRYASGVCVLRDDYSGILWRMDFDETVRGAHIRDVDGDGEEEIVVNSLNRVYILNQQGDIEWQYNITEGISTINFANIYLGKGNDIFLTTVTDTAYIISDYDSEMESRTGTPKRTIISVVGDMDNDGYDDIVVSTSDTLYRLNELDDKLSIIWRYGVNDEIEGIGGGISGGINRRINEVINGIYITDFDRDGTGDIIIITENHIHELTFDGRVKGIYTHRINKFFLIDFDGDGHDDPIILYGNALHVVYPDEINMQDGNETYEGNKTQEYNETIASNIRNETRLLADDYYSNAEYHYNNANYNSEICSNPEDDNPRCNIVGYNNTEYVYSEYMEAIAYLNMAITLYSEINETGNVIHCRSMLSEINKRIKSTSGMNETGSETEPGMMTTTTTIGASPQNFDIMGIFLLIGVPVMLILVLRLFLKMRKPDELS